MRVRRTPRPPPSQRGHVRVLVDDPAGASSSARSNGDVLRLCDSPKTYTEAELAARHRDPVGVHTFEVTAIKHHLLVDAEPVDLGVDGRGPDRARDHDRVRSGRARSPSTRPRPSPSPATRPTPTSSARSTRPAPAEPEWSQLRRRRPRTPPSSQAWQPASTRCWSARSTPDVPNVDSTPESLHAGRSSARPSPRSRSGPADGSSTSETAASFEFSADQGGATFACTLDGRSHSSPARRRRATAPPSWRQRPGPNGPRRPLLRGPGDHDRSGSIEDPPASRDWTSSSRRHDGARDDDRLRPACDVAEHRRDLQLLRHRQRHAWPPTSTFECSLDGAPVRLAADSPHLVENLTRGRATTFASRPSTRPATSDTTPASTTGRSSSPAGAEHAGGPERDRRARRCPARPERRR